ncbi:MAG: AmmeMemoRadiSam system protein B [Nitrospirota bacterium]
MLRQPAVAGYFYQNSPSALRSQVEAFLVPGAAKVRALGIVSPHAGLMYSGAVAGAVYSRIELPGTFVLIGPNHTGLGAPVSLMAKGEWETPLGKVRINEELASALLTRSNLIRDDSAAHLKEHSLEVQLPFIQCLKDEFTIVPVQMMDTRLETCIALGNAVAQAIAECGVRSAEFKEKGVLIVASSDMSHYISAAIAKKKDHKAIQRMLELDGEGLYSTVRGEGITMCGFGPAVAMITACKVLRATKAELVKYTNSGEVSGDFDQVVGYAGIVVR